MCNSAKFWLCLVFCFLQAAIFGQDTTSVSEDDTEKPRKEKGFQVGFFAGTYFANKSTSSLYDGYGLDVNGNKNKFYQSAMYTQIVVYNGGKNGQPDRIAQALNVQPGEWFFTENDMPVNLKYSIAFMAGGSLRYAFNKASSILLNVNTAKLTVNGNFTIVTQTTSGNGNLQPAQVNTFALVGGEQRMFMQLGYQHILGENDKMNMFVEGGVNVTMAKMIRNQINVNGLVMDLMTIYYNPNISGLSSKYRTGVGTGGYAALGANITVGNKWLIQFLYSPSYELVKLGADPSYKLNHAFGVRGYFTF